MSKIKIQSDWEDHLIRCPSQCHLNMSYKNYHFNLYLRWRHNDPWQAYLTETASNFDMVTSPEPMVALSIKEYTESDLELVKKEAIKLARELIYKQY